MKRFGVLIAVVFMASLLDLSTGQSCERWVPAPIQTDPDSLTDPNSTPLGFRTLDLPGDDSGLPGPCVRVFYDNPTRINNIWIPAQSTLSNLCIQFVDAEEATCATGGVFFCSTVQLTMDPSTNMSYVDIQFSCPSSCSSSDVTFFYRVETESLVADDEFWCDNTNRSRLLPQSLAATQAPTVMITQPPVFTGGASTQIVLASFIAFLTMLSAFLIH